LAILERLQINTEAWVDTFEQFGRRFRRAIGRVSSMAAFAGMRGKCWFQGVSASRKRKPHSTLRSDSGIRRPTTPFGIDPAPPRPVSRVPAPFAPPMHLPDPLS
jgi:hypothetical protein